MLCRASLKAQATPGQNRPISGQNHMHRRLARMAVVRFQRDEPRTTCAVRRLNKPALYRKPRRKITPEPSGLTAPTIMWIIGQAVMVWIMSVVAGCCR